VSTTYRDRLNVEVRNVCVVIQEHSHSQ